MFNKSNDDIEKKKLSKSNIFTAITLIIFFSILIINFINVRFLTKEDISKHENFTSFVKNINEKYDIKIELVKTLKADENAQLGVFQFEYDDKVYQFKGELLTGNHNLHHVLSSQIVMKEELNKLFPNSQSYSLIYINGQQFGKRSEKNKKSDNIQYNLIEEKYKLDIYKDFFNNVKLGKDDYILLNVASNEKLDSKNIEKKVIYLKEKYNINIILVYFYNSNKNTLKDYEKVLDSYDGVTLTTFDRTNFDSVTKVSYEESLLTEIIK